MPRRAVEKLRDAANQYIGFEKFKPVDELIEIARRELESEGRDE